MQGKEREAKVIMLRFGLIDGEIKPLITPEELKTLECFHAIVIMPRTMPFKTELLPDYKINWFYETTDAKLPTRKENEISIFKL